jgi:hypothetical protein
MGGGVAAGVFAFFVLVFVAGVLLFGLSIVSLAVARSHPKIAVSTGAISLIASVPVIGWVLWDPWTLGGSFILGGLVFAGAPAAMAVTGIVRSRR